MRVDRAVTDDAKVPEGTTGTKAGNAVVAKSVPKLELLPSRQFPEWLAEQGVSLGFTTYQAGKIFFIGLQPNGRLSVFERTLERCMGLAAVENSLYVATLYQLWRFENALQPGQASDGYDRLYVPQVG